MIIPPQKLEDIQKTLKALYKKWPDIKRFMKSVGCPTTDAEDLFQEALLIFSRKLNDPQFELTVDPFHYVKNTCKLLWYNEARKQGKTQTTALDESLTDYEDDWFQKEMKLKSIEKALSQIGETCQNLLNMFYALGKSMTEIAQKLGFRNDKVAKAQKYRCINKVKDIIRSQESQTL